ncbi:MAG: HAD family hydrolase [Ruminococcaceae bacterium]|nr:HAD family hydrolase [Oscillospiraceae bacterium]
MQHKAVIFDLDGTLLDTLETLSYYGNKTLETLGLAPYEKDAYRYMIGNGAKVLIQRMLKGRNGEGLFDAAYPMYINAYNSDTLFKTEIYPGITGLLTALKEKNIKIAVLSNKPHEATVPIIKSFFGEETFTEIRGAMEGVPIKPDPTAALEIARNLGCVPAECLYVGDTAVDMETGKRAGFYTVGVLWGFRDRAELSEGGADCIIEEPAEILAYL